MSPTEITFTAVLFVLLVTIAVVDIRTLRIPNWSNLALAGAGLAYQVSIARTFPFRTVAFAAIVFAVFWSIGAGYRNLRGSIGLGLGDVKMAAASAFWFSPWNLPLFVLAASLSALIFALGNLLLRGGPDRAARIPFGPFLAFGLAMTWLLERTGFSTFVPDGAYR